MTLEIREVDRTDEAQLRAWWDCGHEALSERTYDLWPSWEQSRVWLAHDNPEQQITLLAAYDESGALAGCAHVQMPQVDNPHMVYADVLVPPPRRRRGTGSALLGEVERRTREAGRSVVLVEAFAPSGGESDGTRFGKHRGYAVASVEQQKVLDLAAAEPGWPHLQAWCEETQDGYRIVEWRDAVPEELIEDYAALLSGFMDQVPLGEMELEASVWTPKRVRRNEQRIRALGRADIHVGALTPDGRLCGITDTRVVPADPRIANVGITIVLEGHRGHRLGLAMKLAAQRTLRAEFPTCELLVTDNAGVNAAMNAVNEALGYRVVERSLDVQRRVVER